MKEITAAGAMLPPTMQENCERIAKSEPEFRKNLSASLAQGNTTDAEIKELLGMLEDGRFNVIPSRDFVLQSAMRQIEEIASS